MQLIIELVLSMISLSDDSDSNRFILIILQCAYFLLLDYFNHYTHSNTHTHTQNNGVESDTEKNSFRNPNDVKRKPKREKKTTTNIL